MAALPGRGRLGARDHCEPLAPLIEWGERSYASLSPLYDEFVEDVRHILRDEEPRSTHRARVREHLVVDPPEGFGQLPPIYRRLFNPVPLDLPEFYVERPELEQQCLEAISHWGQGARVSILLFGERGIGKRTFVHNLVPIKIYDLAPVFQRTPIQTIRLGEEVEDEAQLCRQFAMLFEDPMRRDARGDDAHAAVARRAPDRARGERHEVLPAHRERAWSYASRFLQMINETSDDILWVLLIDARARRCWIR